MSLDIAHYPTLALANTPDELRQLPQERLNQLCDELRRYLLRCNEQAIASGDPTAQYEKLMKLVSDFIDG